MDYHAGLFWRQLFATVVERFDNDFSNDNRAVIVDPSR